MALFFSTFTFDLMLFGFESLSKEDRTKYIIILVATRILGILILSLLFYFTENWVYFILFELCLLALLIPLYLKYTFESILFTMTST
jgi:hypothetical protein